MPLSATRVQACPVCAGSPHPGFALCYCCATLVRQLRLPLVPVVAVVEYRTGDRLHRLLRGYKDAPVAEARTACADTLAGLVTAWWATNGPPFPRPAGPPFDLVATVPSSHRPVGAPVDALVARVPVLARHHRSLLVRGPDPVDHLRAARRGFVPAAGCRGGVLAGRRVLVVDDSVTTGARAQSAAAALRAAGATVSGVLCVGRVVGTGP
jgi:predicted amidophosphoribosyltransferase